MLRALLVILFTVLASSTFAQGNYSVRAGDTLTVEVIEDPSLNRSVLVLPDGNISFPFAGTIRAAGQTTAQISRTITSRIASNFATEPNVFVSVASIPPPELGALTDADGVSVFVIGEVNTPGRILVEPGTTLLQFLAETGGFTRFAATKRIQLRRVNPSTGQPQLFVFNFKSISDGAAVSQGINLVEGDVIIVPERRLFE